MTPNESAFPWHLPSADEIECGLTKRELFAAMMMPAFLSEYEGGRRVIDAAEMAVDSADALLAALATPPEGGGR